MDLPADRDAAIRKEIAATLAANPAASCEAALGNWRYHQHGVISDEDEVRLKALYAEENSLRAPAAVAGSWWQFWK